MSETQIHQLGINRRISSGLSITSPINGQVIEQTGQVGARVDMASPLYTIAQLSPLWLEIHVPVEQALSIQPGMRVSLPKQSLEGKVDSVLRQLNKNNQTMQVRAIVAAGTDKLALGQLVDVDIELNSQTTQFKLPSAALARQGKQNYVFVQSKTGFNAVPIQVIAERGAEVIVHGALTGKERIAISGIAAIKGHWLGLGGE
jgi:multidrug resistance efflux pump